MKRLLKILLGLIALILIVILSFAFTFDANNYKDDIITLVKDKTGRTLSIEGNISLSIFPWIGVDLGKTKLSNAKGFGAQPFAKMSRLQVRAKLLPLFAQRLEADTIVIEGLTLNLAKNKYGENNWDDLTEKPQQTKTTSAQSTPQKPRQKDNSKNILAAFALNGIKVENAQLNWHDQQQKQKMSIDHVQLRIGKLRPESKIPFKIQFHFKEKSLDANVNFESNIIFSSNLKKFSFHDTQLSSELKLASLKKPLSPQLRSAVMLLDLEKQTFNAKKLIFSERTLNIETQIAAQQITSKPYIKAQFHIRSFNPRTIAEDFNITLPNIVDKNALTQLKAQFNVKGALDDINFSNIKLTLDDTTLKGKIRYLSGHRISSAALFIDTINLDRYLIKTPATKSKSAKSIAKTKTTHQSAEVILIPLALLRSFDINTDLNIKKIQIKKTYWNNVNLVAHSKNGDIQINPLTMQGYGAKVESNFTIKALKNNALLSGKLKIDNIKAGKLLNDLTGKDKLKGKTSIDLNFTSSGIKLSQLKQNLNGNLKFKLTNGTLKGFDLNHQKKVLDAKIKRRPIPKAPQPVETKIANLSATAIIKKGILINKDLRASTPLARISGSGTVNLAKENINYIASVKFTSSTKINPAISYEKMNALPLDIRIKGSFDNPRFDIDFNRALNLLLKNELKKQEIKIKDKVKKDIQKELEKRLGDTLKNLFK